MEQARKDVNGEKTKLSDIFEDKCDGISKDCAKCNRYKKSQCEVCKGEMILENDKCVSKCSEGFFVAKSDKGVFKTKGCLKCAETC